MGENKIQRDECSAVIQQICLDGSCMTDKAALHSYLRERMELPDYYGDNFDALYDVLTGIGSPTKIVLENTGYLAEQDWFGRQVFRVFREAAGDNEYLDLIEVTGTYSDFTSEKLTEEGEEE